MVEKRRVLQLSQQKLHRKKWEQNVFCSFCRKTFWKVTVIPKPSFDYAKYQTKQELVNVANLLGSTT